MKIEFKSKRSKANVIFVLLFDFILLTLFTLKVIFLFKSIFEELFGLLVISIILSFINIQSFYNNKYVIENNILNLKQGIRSQKILINEITELRLNQSYMKVNPNRNTYTNSMNGILIISPKNRKTLISPMDEELFLNTIKQINQNIVIK